MPGNIDDQQLYFLCHLTTLGVQSYLLIPWHEYVQLCYKVLHNGAQMTLDISILKDIFLLHTQI